MADYDYLIQLVIIGDSLVGKSNLSLQFVSHNFKTAYERTIGVELRKRTLTIGDARVRLQIWDTTGQESFKSIRSTYYRGAIAMLVFDVTRKETFKCLGNWLKGALNHLTLMIVLVGNKVDLESERQVSRTKAEQFAEARGLPYIETSAKTGFNVEKCFLEVVNRVMVNIEAHIYDLTNVNCGIKVSQTTARSVALLQKPRKETHKGMCILA